MKTILPEYLTVIAGVLLFAPPFVVAGSKAHSLNEDASLSRLLRALRTDHVYDKRISLDCVSFQTEEATDIYYQIVLRENHTPKCGGDPDTSPVVDRYRVYRKSGKMEWYEATSDTWQHYDPVKIRG